MEYGSTVIPGSRHFTEQNDERRDIVTSNMSSKISTTRGFIQGNKIVTMDSRVANRRRGKKTQKEFDELFQSLNDCQAKNSELENQNMRLQTLVLESQNQLTLMTKQYEKLYERYTMLEHLEKWEDIIRNKNDEINRQQEQIRKILTDRTEALKDKRMALSSY